MLQERTHRKFNTTPDLHRSYIWLGPKERHTTSDLKEAVKCCCLFDESLLSWLYVVSYRRIVRLVVVNDLL